MTRLPRWSPCRRRTATSPSLLRHLVPGRLELDRPVLTEASRAANFTNEGGVDGRIRYLRNVGGLWLLQESLRTWSAAGQAADLDVLLAEAARLPAGGPRGRRGRAPSSPPGKMPDRIRAAAGAPGPAPPGTPVAVVRCILDSLALAYARTVLAAEQLAGLEVTSCTSSGAASRTSCSASSPRTLRRPVLAGPVEATALGNLAGPGTRRWSAPAGSGRAAAEPAPRPQPAELPTPRAAG